MTDYKIIVGDQFTDFATDHSVVTLSEFNEKMRHVNDDSLYIIGQGIHHEAIQSLLDEELSLNGKSRYIAPDHVASVDITHKANPSNVLITQPKCIDNGYYHLQLVLEDQHDRLADHITGRHVNGMILVEAARQAAIATSEMELDLTTRSEPWGFVWTGLEVDFIKFAFSVPTNMRLTMVEGIDSKPNKPMYNTTLFFEQSNEDVCEVRLKFELLPVRLLKKLENRAAAKMIYSVLDGSETALMTTIYKKEKAVG